MKTKLAFLALCACALAPLAHADFINGSFEAPDIGDGQLVFVSGANAVPGWDATGTASLISNNYVGSGVVWHNTPAGHQYIYMAINVAGGVTWSQAVNLDAGDNTLSFLQADFATQFVTPGGDLDVLVTRVSDHTIVLNQEFTTPEFSDWIQQSAKFTAPTAELYLFQFITVSGHAGLIDNVTVNSVPEPATLSLLALGVAALVRRRASR